jgi:hypothetical protein
VIWTLDKANHTANKPAPWHPSVVAAAAAAPKRTSGKRQPNGNDDIHRVRALLLLSALHLHRSFLHAFFISLSLSLVVCCSLTPKPLLV